MTMRAAGALLPLLLATSLAAAPTISIDAQSKKLSYGTATISGTTSAHRGSVISVTLDAKTLTTVAEAPGARSALNVWQIAWPDPLPKGIYKVTVTVSDDGERTTDSFNLEVKPEGRLPRRPLPGEERPAGNSRAQAPVLPNSDDFQPFVDRWRIAPPDDYELTVKSKHGLLDPYNSNILKGDKPIRAPDIFLSLTGISDTLFEARTLPTPSGISSDEPGSFSFFGRSRQFFANQNFFITADLFKGDTAFRPADWRMRITLAGNINYVRFAENGAVSPDVRRGIERTDGQAAVQELFVEKKLADLSSSFDFVSARAGIQQFNSDFRGFIFTDSNLGFRLFGNASSNRYQYNLAVFDRLEKDTDSGLNEVNHRRGQEVAVANLYRQDFLLTGYTASFSAHYMKDEATTHYDQNGFLVRPDPVGDFQPHEVTATYLGWSGFGRIGRFNVDHAFYYVFGRDSDNPIAGRDPLGGGVGPGGVEPGNTSIAISASMAAIEVSYDHDWFRPRLGFLYASGDSDLSDRHANGFASIFANPDFAGGGFSFWNRMGIGLPGTGVALTQRGSLLTDLNSSKVHGQPNFVNPGIRLFTSGVDVELTPRAKLILTGNYIQFDNTAVLRGLLFQDRISRNVGVDLSAGLRYRPYLNNNMVIQAGSAVLLPGAGFADIYESRRTLFQLFTNITLVF